MYIFWFQSLKSYFRFLCVFYEKQNKKNILGIQYYHCDNKANKQNDVNMQWKPVHPGFNNSQVTFGFYMLYMERRTYYFVNTRCISLVYYITLLTTNWQTNNVQLIYLPTVVGLTSYDKEHKMLVIYYLASARINGHTVINSWCITIVRLYLTLLLCATFIIF